MFFKLSTEEYFLINTMLEKQSNEIAIEAKDLYYKYPDGTIGLKYASLKVVKNRCTAILGPVGCGKSTLMLILSGLIKPMRGYVKIFGKNLDEYKNLRKDVAIMFQNVDDFLFNPTVKDEIEFSLKQIDNSNIEIMKNIIKKFGLENLLDKEPMRLSEGEKRKVALAAVLVLDPKILLLDEPTAFLDYETKKEVIKYIKEIKRKKTIVVTTHDIRVVKEIADDVILMNKNKETFMQGNVDDILKEEDVLKRIGVDPLFSF